MDGMDEIVREFVVESYENLDRLDRDLVALEGDGESRALLGSIFRTIHTIKGTSGFLGFGALESVTHVGENLLAQLRDGKRPMTQRTTDVLLQMVDFVRVIMAVIEETGAEGEHDTAPVVAEIQQVLDSAPEEQAQAEVVPAEKPADKPAKKQAKKPTKKTAKKLPAKPAEAPAPDSETTPASAPAATKKRTVKPRIGTRPKPTNTATPPLPGPPAPKPSASAEPPVAAPKKSDEGPARSVAESSIRVDVEVLDALMRHVGELVLARNAMTSLATEMQDISLVRASQRLSLIATELQQGVMKTRMQPIDQVWSKVPRMVRDIATSLGRSVKLEMVGKDTELDRSVLEAIKDPLTHLIRNAIDHGIESPADREAAGKPAAGVVTLRAFHQGGQVVVEVADDGKGIDPQVIAEKAVDKGLRTAEQVAAMGPQDVLQMLFLPGFSTAETVTNVSGRGVGMDVVKSKIDGIGGVVDVQSVPGAGTTWRLRIPLTLAIMPALTVACADELYAIPQVNLLELLAIDDDLSGLDKVGDTPVFRLRGRLLPLVDLREVLGRPPRDTMARAVVAVMQADGGRFGLIIDAVSNTEEIVAKPIAAAVKQLGIYAGATLLSDGRVTLILDIPAIARRALDQQEALPDVKPKIVKRDDTEQMLVVTVGDDRRVALPMEAITRLERLSPDVLEKVADAWVMQYRGAITPVGDLATLLGTERPAGTDMAVVVCSRGDRTVALLATEVIDIVDCSTTDRSDVSGDALLGSIVVKGRVTELLDLDVAVTFADPSFFDTDQADVGEAAADGGQGEPEGGRNGARQPEFAGAGTEH